MSLTAGSLLGSYEVIAPLGAGGMGEVYRARDTRLGRDVAIKILPESFALDPERLARFQREAQILAAINHPHIAGIYGLDDVAGVRFLVLELVDGESLAQRLTAAGGPGLGVREALSVARQIVDALEAAHDKGIVHRDLKPGNIMLTHDGQVKVLDFGLAKQEEGRAGQAGAAGGLSHSPTLTFAATQAGVILGTAAYMSPEQAKGRPADKRSDVWAFGCVVFELLAGKRAFEGEDVSDTLAAILRGEPDWSALPPDVPAPTTTLLKRCLAKDRRIRIPDLSVVRFMMDDPIATPAPTGPDEARAIAAHSPSHLRAWQAASAALLATAIGISAAWYASRPAQVQPVSRFFVTPPEKGVFVINSLPGASSAISPDGLKIAFTLKDTAGKVLLWVRSIDSLIAQPLPGTDNAAYPFWSPDSRSIGYSTQGRLMRVAESGGPPVMVCTFVNPTLVGRGGAWNRDGVIVFNNGPFAPLSRVAASGGQSVAAWRMAPGHSGDNFPSFLPDGHHVLFYGVAEEGSGGVFIGSLDTGETTRLLSADTGAVYSPRDGHLLFVRDGVLNAQPFDAVTRVLSGEPFVIADHVESVTIPGFMSFSVSDTGSLSYGIGSGPAAGLQMTWLDRTGKVLEEVGPEGTYQGIALAPDGKRIAAHRHEGPGGDIWITDARGTTSRFTFDASQHNSSPIWSPDGSDIVFVSQRHGKYGVYRKPANNTGAEALLFEHDKLMKPVSWTLDGRSIVLGVSDPTNSQDIWILHLSGEPRAVPWLQTRFRENEGRISPDGRWLAYHSQEGGPTEVFVRPFPSGPGKWQVSTDGGGFPMWRADGRELFYLSRNLGSLFSVAITSTGSTFETGKVTALFESRFASFNLGVGQPYSNYAVSGDGQRILVARPTASESASAPIAVVLNWMQGVKK